MLSAVATCWSPLNEVGPILTSGKLSISNLWKLQKILAERLKSAKEDLRPRKNFKPLTNQGNRPMEWTKFQSKFPRMGWDNDLEKLYLSMLDESDSREAEWTLGLIRNLLMIFKDSVEGLENRTMPPPKVFRTSNFMKPKIFLSGKFLYLLMLQERKVNDCLDMWHTYVSNISREKLAGSLRKGLRFDERGFTKTNFYPQLLHVGVH